MTREEALLKLLSVEPERSFHLGLVTGWGHEATCEVLADLLRQGKVGYRHGENGAEGCRLYYPKVAEKNGDVGALPGSSGKGRSRVRDVGGGLVRANGTLELGRAWSAHPQGSGEETQ